MCPRCVRNSLLVAKDALRKYARYACRFNLIKLIVQCQCVWLPMSLTLPPNINEFNTL